MPIRIAFAEDNVRYRSHLIEMLLSLSPDTFHFVITANDGEELIQKLECCNQLPDMVIMDINMPVMNGYETMALIRQKWPKLKVMGLSLYNDDYVVVKMLYNGASGYITKDMPPKEVCQAIVSFYEHGKYFLGVSAKFVTMSVDDIKSIVPNLTDKEMKFLSLCATEMSYIEMAKELNLSVRTVHSYRDILFKKFEISTRVGLAGLAFALGLATPATTKIRF